jgi:putative phosphoesterase
VDDFLLDALRDVAPVHVVRGNNDLTLDALPETLALQLDGVRVAMIHDSGATRGREARMRRRFPNADLVVFGHSHIPWDKPGHGAQHLFNPGSATLRRRQPHKTMGRITIADGAFATELLVVD